MGGIFPTETSIYVVTAGTNASALASSDKIVGEITDFSLSGGNKDVESIPVIGGFVNKELPREQFEVSFDVIISNTATSTLDRYDIFKYGSTMASDSDGSDKAIFLEFYSNGFTKLMAMNNCQAVTWEPEMAADDMLRGSITFKFSPTTGLGAANLKTSSVSGSTRPSITW
ncbi:MAG TPA: hypothetical protein V6C58_06555 [Allocoleopsis sp.]